MTLWEFLSGGPKVFTTPKPSDSDGTFPRMPIHPGELNGVKGYYLVSWFCPLFFADTPQGMTMLARQIDFEIMLQRHVCIGLAAIMLGSLAALFYVCF